MLVNDCQISLKAAKHHVISILFFLTLTGREILQHRPRKVQNYKHGFRNPLFTSEYRVFVKT